MANGDPDWGVIGGIAVTVVTALAAGIANARGIFRQKSESETASATDRTVLTLDSVFRLVEQLQEEIKRKDAQLAEAERRCAERVERLETRIVVHETAIAGQATMIVGLEQQIRMLSWPKPANPPAELT